MSRYEIGKEGSVHVDGTELPITGWNATDESDWQETTNSLSEGFYEDIDGIKKMSGSFSGSMDLDAKIVPDLAAGVTVALQLDYEDADPAATIAAVGIDSFEVTSEVRGVLNFTCNWHSIGSYAWT